MIEDGFTSGACSRSQESQASPTKSAFQIPGLDTPPSSSSASGKGAAGHKKQARDASDAKLYFFIALASTTESGMMIALNRSNKRLLSLPSVGPR